MIIEEEEEEEYSETESSVHIDSFGVNQTEYARMIK
jgi:hypothetical protein